MIEKESIPGHWRLEDLGSICKTTSGGTPSRKVPDYYKGNIPWVKSGELDNGLILDTEEKITESAVRNSSAKVFPKGTLLIALYGASIGKISFLGIDAATNQAVCGIFESPRLNHKYLFYFLASSKPTLVQQSIGGAQPNISQSILKKLKIPIPPLAEQEQIVEKIEELFSELDDAQRLLETVKEQLKTYTQAVLKSAFDGRLINRNKNKKIPQNGLNWKRLSELIKSVEYGSAAKSEKFGKIPVLRMGNIQDGKFSWSDLVYTNNDSEISKYLLHHNDVLFNRTNSPELVGKTAIYKSEMPAIYAGYLIRINLKEDLLDHDYLAYYLNSPFAKNYGSTVKTDGVNQSNINGQKLKSYPIPYCDLQRQKLVVKEIETRFLACKMLFNTIDKVLSQTEALKQSILKQAFEGKLVRPQTN